MTPLAGAMYQINLTPDVEVVLAVIMETIWFVVDREWKQLPAAFVFRGSVKKTAVTTLIPLTFLLGSKFQHPCFLLEISCHSFVCTLPIVSHTTL